MLYQVERFALGYIENAHESGPFNVPAIRRAISVTVGASIAAVMWWLLRTRTTEAVSYTHLDVYKRQASMMVLNTLKADVFKSISSMFIPFFLAKQRYQM